MKQDRQGRGKATKSNKRWLLLNIAVAIVVILTIIVGYWISSQNEKNSTTEIKEKKIYKISSDAQKIVNTGSEEDAIKAYDNAIEKTNVPDEKISLILSKASIYFNKNDYENALMIAKQAQAIKENSAVTDYLARLYTMLNDNKTAIEYYQKTIPLLNKNSPTYTSDVQYYEDQIKTLGEEV